ncbi:hypothetical protein HHK36_013495 [Tetracentron sinense]|uniref:HMA domain-containing protein n=1 Tax=Tetracentron sinense TaxID=13715 RepID=A0A834Z3G1_TETSI|nr:hypothetical protein HHK36_013495 [Tetracentron sinense]
MATTANKLQKSYFDVLGLCCSSEVPMIEKILKPLEGIVEVSVIVPSRTVIVVHDNLVISQIQIVKALNQARLEANVRVYGEANYGKKWPSPYAMASGILVLLSLFKFLYHPMQWLALGAVAFGLPQIVLRSIAGVRRLMLDINILALIAVGGTIALRDYLEAGFIVFLFNIAEWLNSRASRKATAVMSSLMGMAPQKAVLAETGHVVDAKDVMVNTVLAVKVGEVIPIDGVVVEGKCEVDEKTLTGEPFPVAKQIESIVWAGTINLNGYISVNTTALAEDCVVAKMAKLVEEAQNNKSKVQRFIDNLSKYYTPAVMIISAGVAVVPVAVRAHNLNHWFQLALVVLVSGCPCALILSTPVASFCALAQAARTGLLIKGGDYLEILAKIKVIAFDKTGTITRGEFVVTDFQSISDDFSLNTLLYWVSSIESKSSHPMAAALVDYGWSNSIEPKPEKVKEFQNFPGEGIYGEIDGENIYIGNKKIAMRAGYGTVPTLGCDQPQTKAGQTVGYIYLGATPVGIFSLSDVCRSGVMEAINELKSMGIKTAMLTGDSHGAAMHAQDQLGQALDEVHAELLPEDKVRIINELKKDGPTAMIGDGVNDAPALATADIGISMGISGSALVTETGDITLMSNDIRKIPQALRLAVKTKWKIIQNIAISILTKVVILALAFAGHPLVWAAVLTDVGTCLLVILNSMLILQGTAREGKRSRKSSHVAHVHNHASHGGCEDLQHGDHDRDTCDSNDLHDKCSHSASTHQKCCSPGSLQKLCQLQNKNMCASSHQSRPVQEGSCGKDNCVSSVKMHDSCLGGEGFGEAKHNHHGDCSSGEIHSHSCSNEVKTCDNQLRNDRLGTCTKRHPHKGSSGHPCGINHHHSSSEPGQCTKNASQNHSIPVTCGTNHLNSRLVSTGEVLGDGHDDPSNEEEITTSDGGCLNYRDRHFGCNKHNRFGSHERIDIVIEESTVKLACRSFEKREIGACCKSFRKECGSQHKCFRAGLGGSSPGIAT